jgi:uncharacterized membrane protein
VKRINFFITILSIIEAICYFTPFCLIEEYWKYEKSMVYHGRCVLTSESLVSIWGIESILGKIFAFILLFMTLATAIVYLLNALGSENEICKKRWLIMKIQAITTAVFLVYACLIARVEEISYELTYSFGWMLFIVLALNIVSVVLGILLEYGKTNTFLLKSKSTQRKHTESLDELLQYKELLNMGIISQEEFDTKKKELLRL